jgi:hypothetical protein
LLKIISLTRCSENLTIFSLSDKRCLCGGMVLNRSIESTIPEFHHNFVIIKNEIRDDVLLLHSQVNKASTHSS